MAPFFKALEKMQDKSGLDGPSKWVRGTVPRWRFWKCWWKRCQLSINPVPTWLTARGPSFKGQFSKAYQIDSFNLDKSVARLHFSCLYFNLQYETG